MLAMISVFRWISVRMIFTASSFSLSGTFLVVKWDLELLENWFIVEPV
jgi:hypothetical protein